MSRSVRAALFDVDGTLVDTNYLHAVTWWEAFGQAGYRVVMADIHRAIGMGSDLMLDELLPADRDKDADADIRAAHSTLYATYWSRLRPLPGAAGLLRACQAWVTSVTAADVYVGSPRLGVCPCRTEETIKEPGVGTTCPAARSCR